MLQLYSENEREQFHEIQDLKAQMQTRNIAISELKKLLEKIVTHPTSVSRPQLKSYQVKDKVVPNISQVKFTKKEVEDHHRISSISKKTKSVTVCNNTTNSRTSNVNVVCAECGKCVFNSNHDACVSRYLNVMNARTKKPNVVPIGDSKPKRKANKSVATPHKKIVASDTTIQKHALEILKKHNMDNCHSIGTPLATKPKLDVHLSREPVDQSDYHSKIGSLMYLTSSRPDLVQAVCYYARYQARPTQNHLKE
ncbi:hypothetical protein Tco_0348291, partial [Tanacetum coccineum]